MNKIRKIQFIDHPVLKNLEVDFCDKDGKAVDTVIFAGENGSGKSTVLDSLYRFIVGDSPSVNVEMEIDGELVFISHEKISSNSWRRKAKDICGKQVEVSSRLRAIYSDVDINFHADSLSSVTSLDVDAEDKNRKSANNLPTQIKQLIIDIQALDDAALSQAYKKAKAEGISTDQLDVVERMPRFTKAFEYIFDELTYSRIENCDKEKSILFRKNGVDIPIDQLSSGEKQIVYRGCFLLKDVNAMNGAFVFIDEPEISLHPNWQIKVMDYYKGIFTDGNGRQTSQIFAVTHSPFVIHNDNRRNDKVVILDRDEDGNIVVKDRPEYYRCNSIEAVKDAFSIHAFSAEKPTVYLEGRTDEKYFNRAVEVFGMSVPFRFKWVGYLDERGQETNTGDKSVDNAFQFLVSRNLPIRNICLKDCDTNRQIIKKNNAVILSIPPYQNTRGIKKGIENALVLDDIDLSPYYVKKESIGDYGERKEIEVFDKMKCCNAICAFEDKILKNVFVNLKAVIEQLSEVYNND